MKNVEIYNVTATLNDGQSFECLLLTQPDAATLVAVAKAQNVKTELAEALAFVNDVPKDGSTTDIKVAGTLIGSIRVATLTAYAATVKRGRKPATPTTSATPATPATSEAPEAPEVPSAPRKRSRKPAAEATSA